MTTDARRRTAWGRACNPTSFGKVTIDGRPLTCNRLAIPAFQIFEKIRAHHGYKLTGNDTGFYSCRHMRHDPDLPMSGHSWAMMLDINWLENPAGNKLVTDIPKAMRDDILAVRTKSGARVFRWGGDWDWDGVSTDHSYIDAMHWECVAHPLDLYTGFRSYDLSPPQKEATMLGFNVGPMGASSIKGQEAEALQHLLLIHGEKLPKFGADGFAGDETREALKSFQSKHRINEKGVVGPATYAQFHKPGAGGSVRDITARQQAAEAKAKADNNAARLNKYNLR